ncbi:MAG: non-homologous end-joining DNA ligase [Terriglobales bacterium]|jgi:bifunctional non-homologous end joining protein LigD
MAASTESTIEIQGKTLKLTNLGKVLYPHGRFTKAQVIDYYVRVAPVLLPHLSGRPLTMKRYPGGADQGFFYEKNCPAHRPEWVQTARVWSEGNQRWMDYCMIQDLPTLVWAANLASLELHTSLSLARDMKQPSTIVFDLDPGAPANIVECCQVGLWLRDSVARFKLEAFPKTSGSKGLQVYIPLNSPAAYEKSKSFAHELARLLEGIHPELVVSDMKKSARKGKVLIDWSQNDQHKTTVSVYSLRAKEVPTVSTPVSWEEVAECWQKKNTEMLVFTADQVLARVEKFGDLFEPVLRLTQHLPPVEELAGGQLPELGKPDSAECPKVNSRTRKPVSQPTRAKARMSSKRRWGA